MKPVSLLLYFFLYRIHFAFKDKVAVLIFSFLNEYCVPLLINLLMKREVF